MKPAFANVPERFIYDKLCNQIRVVLSGFVSDQPPAFQLLYCRLIGMLLAKDPHRRIQSEIAQC
jgi:hypothetical protein